MIIHDILKEEIVGSQGGLYGELPSQFGTPQEYLEALHHGYFPSVGSTCLGILDR